MEILYPASSTFNFITHSNEDLVLFYDFHGPLPVRGDPDQGGSIIKSHSTPFFFCVSFN